MKANASALLLSLASAATITVPDASFSLATTDTYTEEEFSGLFTYLDASTCDGPKLLQCEVGVTVTDDTGVEAYLDAVDLCLYHSRCLSYHSILIYK